MPTPLASSVDVVNIWQTRSDDYLIVYFAMVYGLESGIQKHFERHGTYEMFQELKLVFQAHARVERLRPLTRPLPTRRRRIAQPMSMSSECLGTSIT